MPDLMPKLHGVTSLFRAHDFSTLKHKALLFDKLHLLEVFAARSLDDFPKTVRADVEFLQSRGLIGVVTFEHAATSDPTTQNKYEKILESLRQTEVALSERNLDRLVTSVDDVTVRFAAAAIHRGLSIETVPIFRAFQPKIQTGTANTISETVLRVALQALPVPDIDCPWEDILEFKTDMRDKFWGFRRFLRTLATKTQSESEIGDDIEWTLQEYANAMRTHKIKASHSFVDIFVISPLEIIENLAKFNWSKIAKGVLSVAKRDVELLDAESSAPGRECAYLFDARKRFGGEQYEKNDRFGFI